MIGGLSFSGLSKGHLNSGILSFSLVLFNSKGNTKFFLYLCCKWQQKKPLVVSFYSAISVRQS